MAQPVRLFYQMLYLSSVVLASGSRPIVCHDFFICYNWFFPMELFFIVFVHRQFDAGKLILPS